MAPHSGSILRKLQAGFVLAAMLLAGLMALFMDRALHRSLEAEDAQVMAGHARSLQQQLAAGQPLQDGEVGPRPEKASWRVLALDGRILAQSQDIVGLPALPLTDPGGEALEVAGAGGAVYSVLVSPWSRGSERGLLQLVMDRTHEEALVQGFRRTLLLAVVAAMVAAALLARAIARWGLAPLSAIIRETGAISDQNLGHRLASEHFPLELQELVGTLNATLSRLQEAFERLGSLGAELAHELRTPLQNLRSTLENRARQGVAAPLEAAELGLLVEDCDRMAALIEQILFLARSEHAPAELSQTRIPAEELLEEVRGFFEAAAEEADVGLRLQAEPGLWVRGDRLLLTRALHNLTANALRHTAQGGTISLSALGAPDGVRLKVTDNGSGIPPEDLPNIFDRFWHADSARPEDGYSGSGLGLAIARQLVQAHGGKISVESTVNLGTTFIIDLPG